MPDADWWQKVVEQRDGKIDTPAGEAEEKGKGMICSCEDWARRIVDDCLNPLYGLAVTFDCPEHGRVTLDARPVPAPALIRQSSTPRFYPRRP